MNLSNRLMHVTMITAALFFFAGCSSDVQSEKEAPEVNEGVLNKKNQVLRNTLKKESLAIHDLLYQTEAIRGGVLAEEIIADEEQSKLQTALSKNNSATKELLYECGLTEPELIDILGNANDERLALVGGGFLKLLPKSRVYSRVT